MRKTSREIIPTFVGLADYGPRAAEAILIAYILRMNRHEPDHRSEPIVVTMDEINEIQSRGLHCVLGEADDQVTLSVVAFDDTLSP